MAYETAIIIFRHGINDYSLWTVDLPTAMLQEVRASNSVRHGELETVLENIPVIRENAESQLSFIFHGSDGVSLCMRPADEAFMEKYQHEGCSVRGDKDLIASEVWDFFNWQAPELTM